ncbi:DUF58 domain-containing protein [Urbifossiella limnaea]|uniref:DUF58 domain-containing protein n=1 Tax=Urbifossiella limnaea TaxID=2528023 RepID=A0A517XWX5_9BACT|nr:DUF58 domain-containing protein [Urbifossiella limnaea]QDU22006.1 hypothetical protein ETAA1_39810 [Urbifossiella limnaea]
MSSAEKYLRPEVIRQVSRLDLRAKFIVQGFLTGLHASPFHGFSVEFSEHRKYTPGDDLKTLDWNVYAKTGRYYVKKYQAETNMTGYLVMDLSKSMDWNGRAAAKAAGVRLDRTSPGPADETLTKFDYCVCLAAALGYLMILQQDPVGLVAFDTKLATVVPPKSKRTQLGTILSVLANLKPTGDTDIAGSLTQLAPMLRGKSLVMVFSDLITDPEPVLRSLYRLRYSGHEVILFHVLDELEANFPLTGLVDFADVEGPERHLEVDAAGIRDDYLSAVRELRETYRRECAGANVDYVPIDTSVGFDKALLDYLQMRQRRFG